MSEETKKPWYKKWWGITLIVVGVLFVLAIATGSPDKKDADKATTDKTSAQTEPKKEEPATAKTDQQEKVYKVGEEVQVGEVKWLVVKPPEKVKTIGDNEFSKQTAGGIFVILELKAELVGKESGTINASQLKIIDSEGRKYESSNDGQTALMTSGKESLFLKQVNPNVPVSGFATFDIPETATGLKLHIEDLRLFSNNKGLIDLGV